MPDAAAKVAYEQDYRLAPRSPLVSSGVTVHPASRVSHGFCYAPRTW